MGFLAPIAPFIAAAGTVSQGISASQAASFNADVAEEEADAVRQANAINAATREREFQKVQSRNIARAAGKGLKLKGAPMQILIDNAFNFERDQATRAFNAEVQARRQENRGSILRTQSRSLLTTGLITGAGVLGTGLTRRSELAIPKENG